jgi:hypothetical protein
MRASVLLSTALALALVASVHGLRKLEAESSYPICSFNNGVCAPTAAAALSLTKPGSDLEM